MRRKPVASSPSSDAHDAPRSHGRIARAFLWIIATIVVLAVLLVGALYVVTQTGAGTRLLWNNLSRLIPGEISGELVEGTFGNGLILEDVRYTNQGTDIRINQLQGRWRLTTNPLKLTVQNLRIGTVVAKLAPSPEEDKPPTLPQNLKLPLALDVQKLTANKVVVRGEEADTVYENIRLQAKSDSVNHTVQLEEAGTPFGKASGRLKLNGIAPFETDGIFSLAGSYQEQKYSLKADASGTLSELAVKAVAASGQSNAKADIQATPFDRVPLRGAEIHVDDFNPNTFNPEWPTAKLSLDASLAPSADQATNQASDQASNQASNQAGDKTDAAGPVVQGPVSITNAQPGPWNEGRIPLASAQADVRLSRFSRQLSELTIRLAGDGRLTGSGELDEEGQGQLTLTADDLNLHALHTALTKTSLDGPIALTLGEETQTLDAELSGSDIAIAAEAEFTPENILLHRAELSSGPAQLDVSGRLARGVASDFMIEGELKEFNPARFLSDEQRAGKKAEKTARRKAARGPFDASINMDFLAQGTLQPELSADVSFDIEDSRYAGQPMTGGGELRIAGKRVLASDAQLRIAGNRASIKGSFGEPGDKLAFDISAPALARLGFDLSGSLQAQGSVRGTPEHPELAASFSAKNLNAGTLAVASLNGRTYIGGLPESSPAAKTELDLTARGVRSADLRLDRLDVDLNGSYQDHSLRLASNGSFGTLRANLDLAAQGRLTDTTQGLAWAGTISRLENKGTPQLALASPVKVEYAPGSLEVGTANLTLARAQIRLQHLRYDGNSLSTEGSVRQLDTEHLLNLYREFAASAPPVASTLVLNGDWDITLGDNPDGTLRIERTRGDVSVVRGAREIPLGINRLALRADLNNQRIAVDAEANATRLGSLTGEGSIALEPSAQWGLPDQNSAVSARIRAKLPSLQNLAVLSGPSVNLEGAAAADLTIGGTVGDPVLAGTIEGDKLGLTLYDQGLRLREGIARLRIENDIVEIQKLELRGGGGFLRATGRIPLDQSSPDLKASIVAEDLQILSGPAGRLTISGQASASNVNQQLFIGGKFVVDRALFTLPEKRAPELSDDVIIIRDSKAGEPAAAPGTDPEDDPAGPFSPRVSIVVDLGDQFLFEGAGAEVRLAGTIRIESAPGETLQAYGTVRVVEGLYEAFGAELEIERGVLNFQGPLTNPNINILAMRREQEVAAGVQITGTVKQPRVTLVSEPNVPEDEKLSWLVFGRAGGGDDPGQAQAAARGAGLALLNKLGGNRIGEKLGLDEFSIGGSEFGMEGAQVVNLGKEITDRLFLGFEQSLTTAASILKITYELTRHWSVVLRGGDVTGIDIAYQNRFNRFFRSKEPPSPAADPANMPANTPAAKPAPEPAPDTGGQ